MLYHLLTPLSNEATFFNVFRYISFRVAWGMVTALSLCYVLFPPFIRWMRQQRMEQIIRAEGPQSHLETKVGTPTMGGIPMLTAIVVSTLLWARLDNAPIWMALTILAAPNDADVWVIEMGMNHLGEIHHLQEIARPSVRVITNVGAAHLEGVGDLDGVARAKGELFAGALPGDVCCVNDDDERVRRIPIPRGVRVLR